MLNINNSECSLADSSSASIVHPSSLGNVVEEEFVKKIRVQVDRKENYEWMTSGNFVTAVYIGSQQLWLLV